MKKGKITKSLYLWVRSFILVSVVMISILVALITWMVKEFSGEIEELNHGLTSVLQTSIDIRLNDIDSFASQLQMDAINLKLSRSKAIGEVDQEFLIQFFRQLNNYKVSNTFIEEIYVYYPHLNYVIGDLGYFGAERYYLLGNDLQSDGYEAWITLVGGHKTDGYQFAEKDDGTLELCLFRQLPYDLSGDKTAILVIVINKEEVEAILGKAKEGVDNTLAAVVAEDNLVYASYGDEIDQTDLKTVLDENTGRQLFYMGDNFGSVMDSESYGIRYITLIERRKLLNSGFFIRNTAYGAVVLCMVFGVVLFVLLGRFNTKPLKDILDKLASKPESGGRFLDDYDLIDSGISRMLKTNVESSRKLEEQQETIESLFLCNLLSSEERNNSVIFASMQKFGIQMDYSLYQVGLICGQAGFRPEEVRDVGLRIRELLKGREDIQAMVSEFGGDIAVLFHMEPEYGKTEMLAIAGEILEGIRLPVECKMLLGGIYDSMSKIIISFHQAQMVEELCMNERGRVFYYDDAMVGREEPAAYVSVMPEYEMAMLEEKYEEADRLLDLLFNQYIGADHNVYTSRAKKYAVINPVLMALENHGGGALYDLAEYTARLSETKDVSKLLRMLHEGFGYLIRWQKKRQTDQKENLAERAKQYIDSNFEDPMIGLYSISGMLGISNTYLSTTFKKKYGIGIAQYINSLRIEKAKRLIMNTNGNIKEIGLSVGFSSDAAFIRVFKQFENTTPGRFKKK